MAEQELKETLEALAAHLFGTGIEVSSEKPYLPYLLGQQSQQHVTLVIVEHRRPMSGG